jgi:transketolase
MEALAGDPPRVLEHLAVRELPQSGPTADLMHAAGIDAAAIVAAVQRISTITVEPPL